MKDYPICKNCKYYLEEKSGPKLIAGTCALSAVDPVTGGWQRRPQLAAAYRKDKMPCGPSGLFFKFDKLNATPEYAKKKEDPKPKPKPVAKTVKVEAPKVEEAPKEDELLPLEEGQKRRRRRKAD